MLAARWPGLHAEGQLQTAAETPPAPPAVQLSDLSAFPGLSLQASRENGGKPAAPPPVPSMRPNLVDAVWRSYTPLVPAPSTAYLRRARWEITLITVKTRPRLSAHAARLTGILRLAAEMSMSNPSLLSVTAVCLSAAGLVLCPAADRERHPYRHQLGLRRGSQRPYRYFSHRADLMPYFGQHDTAHHQLLLSRRRDACAPDRSRRRRRAQSLSADSDISQADTQIHGWPSM